MVLRPSSSTATPSFLSVARAGAAACLVEHNSPGQRARSPARPPARSIDPACPAPCCSTHAMLRLIRKPHRPCRDECFCSRDSEWLRADAGLEEIRHIYM